MKSKAMSVKGFVNQSSDGLADSINTWLEETEKEIGKNIIIHSISQSEDKDGYISALVVWSIAG